MPSSRSRTDRPSETRDRLLDEAERLFAERGIDGVTTRELTEAAQQRNTSAISYHFGSRQGLLLAVLARRGGPVDQARGALRAALPARPPVPDLVRCLVVPYLALLEVPGGRAYLRIVAQLRGRFSAWRVASDAATTAHLAAVLDELEGRASGPPAVQRERVVALIMLLSAATAERARHLDDGDVPELTAEQFADNLVAMCAAVLTA